MSTTEPGWVDTHVHFFYRKKLTYDWLDKVTEPWTTFLGDYTPLMLNDHTLENYLSKAVPTGVSKIVHVEAAFGGDPPRESAWIQKLADLKKIPIAIVGHADIDAPDIEAVLDRHMESANFRGVRMLWGAAKAENSAFRSGFATLTKRGLSFEDPSGWESFDGICKIAADFPDAKIVLGHCGMPLKRDEEYLAGWREALKRVAQHDNVFCKISGLRMTEHNWTFKSVKRIADTVIQNFGCHRCFFGSNWPVDSIYPGTLDDLVTGY